MAINIYCPFIDLWQSQELSKRWEKTSHAIAEQAKEMRRIMERSSLRREDSYLSLKTKVPIRN